MSPGFRSTSARYPLLNATGGCVVSSVRNVFLGFQRSHRAIDGGWGRSRGERTLSDDPYFYLSRPTWCTRRSVYIRARCVRTCARAYKTHALRTTVSESGRMAFVKQPLYARLQRTHTYMFTHANTCLSACGKKQISPTYAVGISGYCCFFFQSARLYF